MTERRSPRPMSGPRPMLGPRPSGAAVPASSGRSAPAPPAPPAQRQLFAPRPRLDGGVLEARSPRNRPDPNPLRLLLAFAGLASASAVVSAMLPSVVPSSAVDAAFGAPQPSVTHVTRYVTLQPGQTAPPNAPVVIQPAPAPQVHVITRTRQSGLR